MNKRKITIDRQSVLDAYRVSDQQGQELLKHLFGSSIELDVRDRIKTFDDALLALGVTHPLVKQWNLVNVVLDDEEGTIDCTSYMQLRIITAALNEGWKPTFEEEEERWYPGFYLYTKEELHDPQFCPTHNQEIHATANGGISYANAYYDSAYVYAIYGSRLAFRSEELAEYAGTQFIDIYAKYIFGSKE